MREYAASSSAHGIAYIFEQNRLGLERWFWVVVVGVGIVFSICSTAQTYQNWKANPTITTVESTSYPIKNIEYPAITICSQGTSKDIMNTIIMKQFEEYLQSRGIKAQSQSNANRTQTPTRPKRTTEQRVLETLSKEEVYKL